MAYRVTRKWWALVVRGCLAILFGVLAFAWPGITLELLVVLFGAYALVDGMFALAAAVSGGWDGRPWGALLVEAVTGILAGIAAFFWPGITLLVLLYLMAGWAIATGVFEIVAAVQLRRHIEGEWALALSGILSILFGVALAAFPGAGLLAIVWIVAGYAVVFGVLLIALGLRLRGWDTRAAGPPSSAFPTPAHG